MGIKDLLLAFGASLRLTRLVVTDQMGEWYIKDPIDRSMERFEETFTGDTEPWWWKWRSGLDCPFCAGFHIGWITLLSGILVKDKPRLRALWRFGAGALSMNYVAGHLGAKLGDFTETEETDEDTNHDEE